MLASVLLQQVLAHATLAGATARALKHRVSPCHRTFAGDCNARTVEPTSAAWVALVTALLFGLSIRGGGVFLSATAIQLMVSVMALILASATHAAKATKATTTVGNHE